MDDKLNDITERLRARFEARLTAVILYGSAASGDFNEGTSDLNLLCVLSRISTQELTESEPIFKWWRGQGNPPPLLLTENEVQRSTDCFPMEFHDMKTHRRVLHGRDVVADLRIDSKLHRAQVEFELRSKLLRLRQKAAEVLSKPDALARLLSDSLSTFCVLGRHALFLAGREVRWTKQDLISDLDKVLAVRFDAFSAVLRLRAEGKLPQDTNAILLFEKYLTEVDALVAFVDQIEK